MYGSGSSALPLVSYIAPILPHGKLEPRSTCLARDGIYLAGACRLPLFSGWKESLARFPCPMSMCHCMRRGEERRGEGKHTVPYN